MSVYDEIRDNMSTINNANPNHNYKYYMRVFDDTDDFMSDYLDIEDFCKQHKLIVLDYYGNLLYNGDLYRDVFDNVNKKNDVMYRSTEIHGVLRGDWVELYYPEGTDEKIIETLEAALFDLGYEVYICPWDDVPDGGFTYIFVPYPSDEDCLEFAMNETGCKRDEIYIECFDGYEYIPKYRHLEIE